MLQSSSDHASDDASDVSDDFEGALSESKSASEPACAPEPELDSDFASVPESGTTRCRWVIQGLYPPNLKHSEIVIDPTHAIYWTQCLPLSMLRFCMD